MASDTIYQGVRGEEFIRFLISIIKMSNLPHNYISKILNNDTISLFHQCFTHKTADTKDNYEYFEILGDGSINKAVVWYLTYRYPELKCPEGVKFLARLKNNLVSKDNLSSYSERLGFFRFISACEIFRKNKKNQLLEDTFEAFVGCFEYLIDKNIKLHAGYSIVYSFISKLLDQTEIPSFRYETLWDPKSRLKELFDHIGNNTLKYSFKKSRIDEKVHFESTISAVIDNKMIELGIGYGDTKIKSEQESAIRALECLRLQGIYKEVNNSL